MDIRFPFLFVFKGTLEIRLVQQILRSLLRYSDYALNRFGMSRAILYPFLGLTKVIGNFLVIIHFANFAISFSQSLFTNIMDVLGHGDRTSRTRISLLDAKRRHQKSNLIWMIGKNEWSDFRQRVLTNEDSGMLMQDNCEAATILCFALARKAPESIIRFILETNPDLMASTKCTKQNLPFSLAEHVGYPMAIRIILEAARQHSHHREYVSAQRLGQSPDNVGDSTPLSRDGPGKTDKRQQKLEVTW